jgi:hypothetical protein
VNVFGVPVIIGADYACPRCRPCEDNIVVVEDEAQEDSDDHQRNQE